MEDKNSHPLPNHSQTPFNPKGDSTNMDETMQRHDQILLIIMRHNCPRTFSNPEIKLRFALDPTHGKSWGQGKIVLQNRRVES